MGLGLILPAGVLFIVLTFYALYRLTPLNALQAAVVAALLGLSAYLPWALIHWPGADVFAMHVAVYLVTAYMLGVFTSVRARQARGKWFHWGPAAIVIFFMVILAMDAVFVAVSVEGLPRGLDSQLLPQARKDQQEGRQPESQAREGASVRTAFPGMVYQNYYEQESRYNDYLARRQAQRERGWQVRKGWLTRRPQAGTPAAFQVAVQDRAGQAVRGAVIQGRFLRAADSRLDREFEMHETQPGMYQARINLPAPGRWDLHLLIRHGDAQHEVRASTSVE